MNFLNQGLVVVRSVRCGMQHALVTTVGNHVRVLEVDVVVAAIPIHAVHMDKIDRLHVVELAQDKRSRGRSTFRLAVSAGHTVARGASGEKGLVVGVVDPFAGLVHQQRRTTVIDRARIRRHRHKRFVYGSLIFSGEVSVHGPGHMMRQRVAFLVILQIVEADDAVITVVDSLSVLVRDGSVSDYRHFTLTCVHFNMSK